MNDIAAAVGINKSSLYSHYSGKDELYLAVFADIGREQALLFEKLLTDADAMETKDKLGHHFKGYIVYLNKNPEISLFMNTGLFHIPLELREKLRAGYLSFELPYRQKLTDIFASGMDKGIIRKGDPAKKVWSFKVKRDGVAAWIYGSPDLGMDDIGDFWQDFWSGVAEKKQADKRGMRK